MVYINVYFLVIADADEKNNVEPKSENKMECNKIKDNFLFMYYVGVTLEDESGGSWSNSVPSGRNCSCWKIAVGFFIGSYLFIAVTFCKLFC